MTQSLGYCRGLDDVPHPSTSYRMPAARHGVEFQVYVFDLRFGTQFCLLNVFHALEFASIESVWCLL